MGSTTWWDLIRDFFGLFFQNIRIHWRRKTDAAWNYLLKPRDWWTHSSDERWARWFYRNDRRFFSYQINPFYYKLGFFVDIDTRHGDSDGLHVSFCIPFLVALWLSFDFIKFRERNQYRFRIDNHSIGFNWGGNDCAPNREGVSWSFYWDYFKFIKSRETIETDPVAVTFKMPAQEGYPETNHGATIVRSTVVWSSQFWLFKWKKEFPGWEIRVPNPPIYEGKGENSWDCEPTGTYSSRIPDAYTLLLTTDDVIQNYIEGVRENRRRYG